MLESSRRSTEVVSHSAPAFWCLAGCCLGRVKTPDSAPFWPSGGGVVAPLTDGGGQSGLRRGREKGREFRRLSLSPLISFLSLSLALARIVKLSLPRRRHSLHTAELIFFFLFRFVSYTLFLFFYSFFHFPFFLSFSFIFFTFFVGFFSSFFGF